MSVFEVQVGYYEHTEFLLDSSLTVYATQDGL